MVRARRGVGKLGCLVLLLIVAVVGYFGEKVGVAYWHDYLYRDRMRAEAEFASRRSDVLIKRRLAAFADSIGLPEGASNVIVRRGAHSIYIYAEYYQHIEMPGFVREFHFSPSASGTF
jgi:hypothetical protein